jgi:hypothetical protein
MPTRKRLQNTRKSDDYEQFILGLELYGVGLKGCSATLDRAAFFAFGKKGTKAVRKITEHYEVTSLDERHFDSEGRFSLTISDPSKKPALAIECVFEVHMHGNPPVRRELAERFTSSELRLILTPFFRHFITTTMAQMVIPPIIIPLASKR